MIGTTAAILGSAVIGAGVEMAGASKAAKTSQKNTDKQIAEERANSEAAAKRLDPFVQGGYVGNNALLGRLGLAAPAGAAPAPAASAPGNALAAATPGTPAPAAAPTGQPDWASYVQGNGDLLDAFHREGNGRSIEQYAQDHWYGIGSTENRAVTPFSSAAPTQAPAAQAPVDPAAATGPASTTPAALTGNPYSYGNSGNPTFEDKGFSYGAADYKESPAYAYTVDQAMKGALAGASATGALKSGATLKALQDRAAQLAYQDFGNERNFARASYDTNRAFNYGQYTDSRNYLTNRADAQTANLFDLTKLGANAAAGVNQSGENATNGIVNALGTNASNQGNAAIAGANATTSLLGSGMNALAYGRGYQPSLTSSVMQGVNSNPNLF